MRCHTLFIHELNQRGGVVEVGGVSWCGPHLEQLVRRAVVDGGRRRIRLLVAAPLQLAETVDAVKVARVQLGQVDVGEVSIQAVRTHLLLPILVRKTSKGGVSGRVLLEPRVRKTSCIGLQAGQERVRVEASHVEASRMSKHLAC